MNQYVNNTSFEKVRQVLSPEVQDQLGNYVYRLIDPRNGETFYVGKGKGNRIYAHINEESSSEDDTNDKLNIIRDIKRDGFDVAHVIHRHKIPAESVLEVEAALIDAYPRLTNKQGGYKNNENGLRHIDQIIQKYSAEEAQFQHNTLLLMLKIKDQDMYEQARFAWKLNNKNLKRIELVMAVYNGMIRGIFRPTQWLEATEENFPGKGADQGRIGFEGHEAEQDIQDLYLHKKIPKEYRSKQNPIRYAWVQ